MCLDTVDTPTKHKRKRVGYKVMRTDAYGILQAVYQSATFQYGKEATAEGGERLSDLENHYYERGFHIFRDKRSATIWRSNHCPEGHVFKVSFRNVLASGIQLQTNNTPALASSIVVVAKHVMVLKKV